MSAATDWKPGDHAFVRWEPDMSGEIVTFRGVPVEWEITFIHPDQQAIVSPVGTDWLTDTVAVNRLVPIDQ